MKYDLHKALSAPETVTEDGWRTHAPGYFRFMHEHTPPRPYPYWAQLKEDARHLSIWLLIGTPLFICFGVLAFFGLVYGYWELALVLLPPGALVLCLYLFLLHKTVSGVRSASVTFGRITGTHYFPTHLVKTYTPEVKGISGIEVTLPNGEKAAGTLHARDREALAGFFQGREVEVIIEFNRKSKYHNVLGFRIGGHSCSVKGRLRY